MVKISTKKYFVNEKRNRFEHVNKREFKFEMSIEIWFCRNSFALCGYYAVTEVSCFRTDAMPTIPTYLI